MKNMNKHTSCNLFPFSNFRYSLTLFSKFFASFPHGTCALSVSHPYLALDGIYHPLCSAIPNKTTQRPKLILPGKREYHPLCCPVPRNFTQQYITLKPSDHNSARMPILIVGSSRFTRRYTGNPS